MPSSGASSTPAAVATGSAKRWGQLLIGILCMSMIANLQYGWTLFVNPIHDKFLWTRAEIQVAFTIFVLTEPWLVPIEGYLVDRFGPRPVTLAGGLMVGISWVLNAHADSLMLLYISAAIGGTGAGAVYGTCVGNALKWFPDHRGLAAGLTAAGFGAGSALTIIPIANMIASNGYQATFLTFGLFQGIVVFIASWFLSAPKLGEVPLSKLVAQVTRNFNPMEVLRQPVFWVMFVVMTSVGVGGQMATAQLGPIATDWGVDKTPVSFFGITLCNAMIVLSPVQCAGMM